MTEFETDLEHLSAARLALRLAQAFRGGCPGVGGTRILSPGERRDMVRHGLMALHHDASGSFFVLTEAGRHLVEWVTRPQSARA